MAPGDLFGPRYRIMRLLGAGGMGIVYHAWDDELGVAVALKIIRPEVSADATMARELEKRFKRELLLARQVTHHNVVRIHDIGEVERTKYITMSFIDGRDLATELKSTGHLTVPRALHILRKLAEGLQAAHEAGVIHRDLKPANIMIEGDTPIIMDFGIARSALRQVEGKAISSTQVSRSALLTGATMQGAVVGTVAYMSPEQAKGQPADQRSDIYAVGMIMRDMLVGMRDVENPTDALNELMERVQHAPKPVLEIDPSIPPDVDRIVTRCLQPEAAARYQSVQELLKDLNGLDAEGRPLPKIRQLTKRIVGAAALLVLALLAGTWWLAGSRVPPAQPPATSVLVADFENRVGDPVFTGSLEQALSIAIEGASFITVYPRRDALRLAAQEIGAGTRLNEPAARLVSRREGIKYILAGAIEPRGSRYALSLKAVDPADGRVIETANATASDKSSVLKAVGSLAASIREVLGDTTPASERLAGAETVTASSLEAMSAYGQGQDLAMANRIDEALKAYEQAVSLDPRFGRAYAGMGVIYRNNFKNHEKAEAQYQQAMKHLDRMTDREKYRTLGTYYLNVVRNYEKAIENYETLVRLYPADDGGHGNLALAYLYVGNVPRAVEGVRRSLEIYPKNLLQRYNYAMYSMYAGDFATAIQQGQQILQENPSFEHANLPIALSNLMQGNAALAGDAYGTLEKLSPLGRSMADLGRADMEMYFGRHRAALAILRRGMAADQKDKDTGALAQKLVASAEAHVTSRELALASAEAARAAVLGAQESILFPSARVLLETGRIADAEKIAGQLESMLQRQTIAYARLIQGEAAMRRGRLVEAVEYLRDAVKRHDSWFGRFLLGRVYAETEHYPEALAEFEICLKRRGETADVFFYDMSTARYLPPLYYWLARAQEGMGVNGEARKNYQQFLDLRSGPDASDPLVKDARRRFAAL
ncbi:MAG TPA: protein kinase [Vicinamibacterales bacterium]|nr:protein kinase [Vicinamibacterales bacterium]